jgi:sugar phosphate isomerase/epimerase
MPRTKFYVSAQLYTLRDYLTVPKDMRTTMRKIRKIGYTSAQISAVGPIPPADLRLLMLDEGVEPVGAHIGLDAFEDIAAVAATCHAWGVKYVAIPWMPADAVQTAATWKQTGRRFSRYGKALAKHGITLQYHNHAFEFQKYGIKGGSGGRTGLEILYDNSDPEYLQAELDFGWIARGGQNPVTWAKKLTGRLDQVHVKDWGILNNEPVWRAVGEGGIDWPAVIKACKVSGTRYFLVEQDTCPITNNPFKSLQVSFENLKAFGLR